MVQFAHANEETVLEKGVLHAVYMALPRPHPLRVAGHFASTMPKVSLTTAAHAEAAPEISRAAASAPDQQKNSGRVDAPAAGTAVITVTSATESIAMPRVVVPAAEPVTGAVTIVAGTVPLPAPRPERYASLTHVEHADTAEVKSIPLPRANPLPEVRHTQKTTKKSDRTEKKSGNKNEKKAGKHAERKKRRA
jgi:hypothetical protein